MKGGDRVYLGAEARTNVGIPSYEVMKRGTLFVDPIEFPIDCFPKIGSLLENPFSLNNLIQPSMSHSH